jgi:hypothetical protein
MGAWRARSVVCTICGRAEESCRKANSKGPDPHQYSPPDEERVVS